MKRYLSLLMCILGFVPILAHQSEYYYYYKDERIDLTVDSTRLFVVTEGELQPQNAARSNTIKYNISKSARSYIYNNVVPLQKQRTTTPEVYFSTVDIPEGLTTSLYDVFIENVKAEKNVWQVLPSFTIDGNRVDVTNNFYVKLKSYDDFEDLQQMAILQGFEIVGNNEFMPLWYTLSCNTDSPKNSIEAANLFYSSGLFECSEPEIISYNVLSVNDVLNDDFYENQWALHNYNYPGIDINIDGAWSISKGEDIVVAIVDEGIYGSFDFLNKIYHKSYDAKTGVEQASCYGLHGTYCAGIVGAVQNNGYGISGVAPGCKLMPVSIDFNDGASVQHAANAISWAWKNDADVMSCSWGYNAPSSMLTNAVDSALTFGRNGKGCVLVFASGNRTQINLSESVMVPANSHPNVIAVGAIKPCGERAGDNLSLCCADRRETWESCFGENLDVVAPGASVTTITLETEHWSGVIHGFNGTSAACPHVAGVAALMLSVNPDMPVEAVDYIIGKTARKVRSDVYSYQKDNTHNYGTWNEKMGYGLIDATAAVEMAMKPTIYVWRQSHYEEAYGAYYELEKDIDMKNITVEPGDVLHIFKGKKAILRSSVRIKKGGEALITFPL